MKNLEETDRLKYQVIEILTDGFDNEHLVLTADDWKSVLPAIVAEGVAPLVYWKLREKKILERIPDSAKDELSKEFFNSTARNLLIFSQLCSILKILSEYQILIALLKGADIGISDYVDNSLRPMDDLDLLIDQSQLPLALKVLKSKGYRVLETTYHVNLMSEDYSKINIELHWSLFYSNKSVVKTNWFKDYTEKWTFSDLQEHPIQTYRLRLEVKILYLISHLVQKHGDFSPRLIWVYDLYLLISKHYNEIRIPKFCVLVDRFDLKDEAEYVLHLTSVFFNCYETVAFYKGVVAFRSSSIGYKNPNTRNFSQSQQIRIKSAWKILPLRLRFGAMISILFPNKELIQWRYSSKWYWPIFYIVRIFKLTTEFVINVIFRD